jgi:hypothetical protein
VIVAVPAAIAAVLAAARLHWILALALVAIAVVEARADGKATR